jgi:hypothetical protein
MVFYQKPSAFFFQAEYEGSIPFTRSKIFGRLPRFALLEAVFLFGYRPSGYLSRS